MADGSYKTASCGESSLTVDGNTTKFIGYESPSEVASILQAKGIEVNQMYAEYFAEAELEFQIVTPYTPTQTLFGEEVSI
ncbi:hypothetical protein A3D07_00505 [Candidatus Curtissbacteria bacterium RIFCSPHIGHO2_02_FULL_42_15]|uniref:Uncharacterized protein n=1 Tax=Candidatus Curtissbacteria bacterium RIFCSPHIGHO2_02_FULL_42_15 TaxID=1797716 RepID=A0A1F5GJY0_9BACT|nr:MAG: hypothetical protein A3D07_00505 [Candidatus Curtissbacteria bacterium RIFCSPHIGHO2_02_FULL_42_15]